MTEDKKSNWQTFVEEIEVSGQHLLTEINRLIAEGNVRKLVVKTDDNSVFLTIPLTAGVVAGGVLTLGAPGSQFSRQWRASWLTSSSRLCANSRRRQRNPWRPRQMKRPSPSVRPA
jgi:hypothetical protein